MCYERCHIWKHGQKHKSAMLEADKLETQAEAELEVTQTIKELVREVAQTLGAPEQWIAPVARMY